MTTPHACAVAERPEARCGAQGAKCMSVTRTKKKPSLRPRKERPAIRLGATLASLSASLLAGCGSDQCLDNAAFYEQKVWTQVVSKSCIKCHAPEGAAAAKNAKFIQLSQAFPSFLELNLANFNEVAKTEYEGKSAVLRKPLGEMNHGGGKVLDEGSDEYKVLSDMVNRVKDPVSCGEQKSSVVPQLEQLDPVGTLRKAALQLGARLPTAAEEESVKAGGEEALDPALDALLNEAPFLTVIKEIYGDVMLTGRYNQYDGQALGLLNATDYPGVNWWNPAMTPDNMLTAEQRSDRKWSGYGIAAEPLELIAYVAKNNKPFSEILTADYTVVNYQSAKVYGLDPAMLGLSNPGDYYSFKPAKLSVTRAGNKVPVPHAGVITTPVYLNRWSTTATNLNRARARMTYKFFLATDLLAVAERPIDPSSVTSTNPTRDDQYCTSCHKIIDPVASTYQKWDGAGRFQPTLTWPTDMPQPGFGTAIVDNVQQYPSALQFLAKQVTQDTRFGMSVLTNVYVGLVGHEPLPYPAAEDPAFEDKQKAWQEQNKIFQEILTKFTASNQNVKEIVKGLIKSPIYRATSAKDLSPAAMEAFGTGRLLTPESLARKLPATLGIRWLRDRNTDLLTSDYNLLYGGIDFENVTKRLTSPNAIIGNVGQRMATEMACYATAWDFLKPQPQRLLFKYVETSQYPEDDNGFAVPTAVENIRKTIQYLHGRLLGEYLDINDPEIERTYQLYLATYRELQKAKNAALPYECQGRWDRTTGDQLPMASVGVTDDKYYTVRSWMAVVSYLLLDWKYLYE
jgi:hypothetical protein